MKSNTITSTFSTVVHEQHGLRLSRIKLHITAAWERNGNGSVSGHRIIRMYGTVAGEECEVYDILGGNPQFGDLSLHDHAEKVKEAHSRLDSDVMAMTAFLRS